VTESEHLHETYYLWLAQIFIVMQHRLESCPQSIDVVQNMAENTDLLSFVMTGHSKAQRARDQYL